MSYTVKLTHTPKKKAKVIFEFNTDTNVFTHNETGPMRADMLNSLGNKLSTADLDYHYSTVYDLERWLSDVVYVPLEATDKAAINKFKKKAISALNKVIKVNKKYTDDVRQSLIGGQATTALNLQAETNGFDDVLSKDFNNEEKLVDAKHLNDDFDFDDSNDFDFGDDTPVNDKKDDNGHLDDFGLNESIDEPEPKIKDEIDLKLEALLIEGARGLETLLLSLAGLCRLVIEQHNPKPSE